MLVQIYEKAQTFLEEYENTMLEREAVSQMLLYNAYQNRSIATGNEVLYGAVLKEGEAILLFCNVDPYKLTVYVTNMNYDKTLIGEAVIVLAEYMLNNHISFTGINARHDVCFGFIECYKTSSKYTFEEKVVLDIMEIRSVNDIKPAEGSHRLANMDEAKIITDWMIQFAIDAMESEMDYEAALSKASKLITENKVFVYEDMNQEVVSMAIATRQLQHGIAIGYVFTPEKYRGMGYAAANVHYLSKYFLEKGNEFCSLFVDKKNPISSRAYEKVGYHILEENYEYIILPQETKQLA